MLKVNQENIGDKRHLSSIQEYCFDLHHSTYQGPVAQRIRHLTTNQGIAGSSPARVKYFLKFSQFDYLKALYDLKGKQLSPFY